MLQVSDLLLKFLIPGLKNCNDQEIQDILMKSQLEIEKVELKGNNYIYEIKTICNFYDSSRLWVLAQEIAINLENPFEDNSQSRELLPDILNKQCLENNEDDEKNIYSLLKLLFGEDLSSPLSSFLISDFCEKFPECREDILKYLDSYDGTTLDLPRAESRVDLSGLLPIFSDLRDKWEEKVVSRLKKHNFKFEKEDSSWKAIWPPWYSQENLPPFSEILSRLVVLDQGSKPIKDSKDLFESSEGNSHSLGRWKQLRAVLKEKGFVECNTCKLVKVEKNLQPRSYCLSYNKQLTLRDNLHYSLVFEVLLENLNRKNLLYPVFELSYCPWEQKWLLGMASEVNFKSSEASQSFWYSLEDFVKILKELLGSSIEFQKPNEEKYIPQLSAALIYNLVSSSKGVVGKLLVHRLEQFEIRKKEVISASVQLL